MTFNTNKTSVWLPIWSEYIDTCERQSKRVGPKTSSQCSGVSISKHI